MGGARGSRLMRKGSTRVEDGSSAHHTPRSIMRAGRVPTPHPWNRRGDRRPLGYIGVVCQRTPGIALPQPSPNYITTQPTPTRRLSRAALGPGTAFIAGARVRFPLSYSYVGGGSVQL